MPRWPFARSARRDADACNSHVFQPDDAPRIAVNPSSSRLQPNSPTAPLPTMALSTATGPSLPQSPSLPVSSWNTTRRNKPSKQEASTTMPSTALSFRKNSTEDITALPMAQSARMSPHLRPVAYDSTIIIPYDFRLHTASTSHMNATKNTMQAEYVSPNEVSRPPSQQKNKISLMHSKMKRPASASQPHSNTARVASPSLGDRQIREEDFGAMSASSAPPRKVARGDAGPLERENRTFREGLNRSFSRPVSSISLPRLYTGRSNPVSHSDGRSYRTSVIGSLNPHPVIQAHEPSSHAMIAAGWNILNSRGVGGPPNTSLKQTRRAVTGSSRIGDLADALSSVEIHDILKRDAEQKQQKRDRDAERLRLKLERRAEQARLDDGDELIGFRTPTGKKSNHKLTSARGKVPGGGRVKSVSRDKTRDLKIQSAARVAQWLPPRPEASYNDPFSDTLARNGTTSALDNDVFRSPASSSQPIPRLPSFGSSTNVTDPASDPHVPSSPASASASRLQDTAKMREQFSPSNPLKTPASTRARPGLFSGGADDSGFAHGTIPSNIVAPAVLPQALDPSPPRKKSVPLRIFSALHLRSIFRSRLRPTAIQDRKVMKDATVIRVPDTFKTFSGTKTRHLRPQTSKEGVGSDLISLPVERDLSGPANVPVSQPVVTHLSVSNSANSMTKTGSYLAQSPGRLVSPFNPSLASVDSEGSWLTGRAAKMPASSHAGSMQHPNTPITRSAELSPVFYPRVNARYPRADSDEKESAVERADTINKPRNSKKAPTNLGSPLRLRSPRHPSGGYGQLEVHGGIAARNPEFNSGCRIKSHEGLLRMTLGENSKSAEL